MLVNSPPIYPNPCSVTHLHKLVGCGTGQFFNLCPRLGFRPCDMSRRGRINTKQYLFSLSLKVIRGAWFRGFQPCDGVIFIAKSDCLEEYRHWRIFGLGTYVREWTSPMDHMHAYGHHTLKPTPSYTLRVTYCREMAEIMPSGWNRNVLSVHSSTSLWGIPGLRQHQTHCIKGWIPTSVKRTFFFLSWHSTKFTNQPFNLLGYFNVQLQAFVFDWKFVSFSLQVTTIYLSTSFWLTHAFIDM